MLKLISLNLELNKHFSKNIPFLQSEKPDILCVQELFKKDIPLLMEKLNMQYYFFAPMYLIPYFGADDPRSKLDIYGIANDIASGKDRNEYELAEVGIGIFSKKELTNESIEYYNPIIEEGIKVHDSSRREETVAGPLLSVTFDHNGSVYRVVNTHFTWSGKGEASDLQRADLEAMLGIMNNVDDCIFCGDFNAPRGGEIFSKISERFKDNIPEDCITTLDHNIHRAGPLDYVVDGLFSTQEYDVSGVRVCGGVSDHKAVVAMISKNV